ncbi:MAG: electron transfer flavoprotein subunit beta/FixA family protein [Anaerolineae bacterium]
MNIIVCIKQVPDTASRIEVKDGKVVEEGLTWVINPYDEYAIEEALRIKERFGEGKVTLVTMGPERAKDALKGGLALGADEAVHLMDPAFEGSDPYATAKVLAQALEKMDYDLIFCGWKGVDHDEGQTAIILAEMLNLPHVSFVVKLDIAEDRSKAVAHRQVEGAKEVVETPLPAVFTAQKGLNEPRYASLRGIMAVKKKTIAQWGAADLGLDPSTVGSEGSLTEMVEVVPPPERPPGRIIPGEPAEAARELVRLLREEAKVI